jgi:hypothetical protein
MCDSTKRPRLSLFTQKRATGLKAWEVTDHKGCTLYWEGGRKQLTIPLGEKDNVATMQLTPGYKKFHTFCDNAPPNHDHDPIIMQPATTISDDEGDDDDQGSCAGFLSERDKKVIQGIQTRTARTETETTPSEPTDFDLNGTNESNLPEVNVIEEDIQRTNLSAKLLRIHHRMDHAPFRKLQELAKQGALLARLKNCPIPMCTACAYGKASRKAWRGKTLKNLKTSSTHLQPGDMVLVNQMVLPIPGLVAQITGILTTKRYKYATVYVDQTQGWDMFTCKRLKQQKKH